MKRKLNCVLLIDDSEATNFVHKRIVDLSGFAEHSVTVPGGIEALDYINTSDLTPELIFLDINMPAMNGWEFLEEYKALDKELRSKSVIVMLTTSMNPDDQVRASTYKEIREYAHKPLSIELIENLMDKYFRDN